MNVVPEPEAESVAPTATVNEPLISEALPATVSEPPAMSSAAPSVMLRIDELPL